MNPLDNGAPPRSPLRPLPATAGFGHSVCGWTLEVTSQRRAASGAMGKGRRFSAGSPNGNRLPLSYPCSLPQSSRAAAGRFPA